MYNQLFKPGHNRVESELAQGSQNLPVVTRPPIMSHANSASQGNNDCTLATISPNKNLQSAGSSSQGNNDYLLADPTGFSPDRKRRTSRVNNRISHLRASYKDKTKVSIVVEKSKSRVRDRNIADKRDHKNSLKFIPEGRRKSVTPPHAIIGGLDVLSSLNLESPATPVTLPRVASSKPFSPQANMNTVFRALGFPVDEGGIPLNIRLDTSTRETISDFTDALSGSMHKVGDAYTSGIDKTISFAGDTADLVMLSFVVSVLLIWKPRDMKEKGALCLMVFVYLGGRGHLTTILQKSGFMEWAAKSIPTGTVPQSGVYDDVATVITGILSTFVLVQGGKSLFKVAELAKVISTCGRLKMGVKAITDCINIVVAFIHSSIESWSTGNPFYLMSGTGFIDEFLKESKLIMGLFESKKLHNLQSSLDRVNACIEAGETVAVKIPGNADVVGYRLHVNNILNELRKIKRVLLSSNFMFSGNRTEPVAVMFRGPPGAGKSQAMMHTSNALNALTLNPEEYKRYAENPGAYIQNRLPENEYWDGYKFTTNVVLLDDLGQAREVQGNPDCESMSVIRMVNMFEYPLHMATLEDKGTTNFRAKFVLANTNTRNFHFEAINSPDAFMRRWDIVVDVFPKEEYSTYQKGCEGDPWKRYFDKKKLPVYDEFTPGYDESKAHLLGQTLLLPEFCDYHVQRYNRTKGQFSSTGEIISFAEFIDRVHDVYKIKAQYNEIFLDGVDNTLRMYRSRYVNPEDTVEEVWEAPDDILMEEMKDPPWPEEQEDSSEDEEEARERERGFRPRRRRDAKVRPHMNLKPAMFAEDSPPLEIGVNYSLTRLPSAHMCEIKSLNAYNYIFIDALIKKLFEYTLKNELSASADDNYHVIIKTLGELGVYEIDAQNIKIDFPTVLDFAIQEFENFSCEIITTNPGLWERLGKKSDDMLKALKDTTHLPPWAKKIYDVQKQCASWLYAFGSTAPFYVKQFFSRAWNFPGELGAGFRAGIVAGGIAICLHLVVTIMTIINRFILYPKKKKHKGHSDERSSRIRRVRVIDKNIKNPARLNRETVTKFTPQSFKTKHSNVSDIISSIEKTNCLEVYLPMRELDGKPRWCKPGYALAIGDHNIMMPYHFGSALYSDYAAREIDEDDEVKLVRPGSKYTIIALTVREFLEGYMICNEAMEQDILLVQLPQRCNPFKDIRHLFATRKQHEMYSKIEVAISIPSVHRRQIQMAVAEQATDLDVDGDPMFEAYVVQRTYSYKSFLQEGDCGSLAFVVDNSVGSPLIGMHVAGNGTYGHAARLTREEITEWINSSQFDAVYETKDRPCPEGLPAVVMTDVDFDNLKVLGMVPQSAAPRVNTKTKLARSPLYGLIEPVVRAPAHLKPFMKDGEIFDPNTIALKKYCEEDKLIPYDLLEEVTEQVGNFLENNSKVDVPREVLSYQVAVQGDGTGTFDGIPRTKSAGYPYVVQGGKTTKARFWGSEPEYDFFCPAARELEAEVMKIEAAAFLGKRCVHIYVDHLKDERRSMKKVEKGETRLISASPTPLLIIFRRYFGAFVKWLMLNKINNGMCIGINEHGSDWDYLAKRLNRFGKGYRNFGAGDYQGFDQKHKNSVAWAICDLINDWYNDEFRIVREIFWMEIVNSYHINGNLIIEWRCALPSGAPPTTAFNCIANRIYMGICYKKLIPHGPAFHKAVELQVLGDDHVFSTHPSVTSLFNEVTLVEAMAGLGQVYTPEDKELAKSLGPRLIGEVSFLKRKFFEQNGIYLAPLELGVIIDMMNWTKKGPNVLGDVETNIQTAFEELTLHGPCIFETYKAKIFDAIKIVPGLSRPAVTNYRALFTLIKERDSSLRDTFNIDLDYDVPEYKIPGCRDAQIEHGRLEDESSSLLSVTPKTLGVRFSAQSSLGASDRFLGETHSRYLNKRAATTTISNTNGGNRAPEFTALTTDGSVEAVRTAIVSNQTSGTTVATVDAETPSAGMAKYTPLSSDVLDQARTGTPQDVKDFLRKPQVIGSGLFTTGDTYGGFFYSTLIPQSLLYNNDVWKQKVQGNFAFKGTLVATLQVNGTRQQQGRYMLLWCPSGGGINVDKWWRMHAATLVQATQLPHVEVDLNCDTEATLRIPHVTAQGWAALDFPGGSTYGNNGMLFGAVYSPLQVSTGPTNCGWTLFAHWEDVEVSLPIAPQMSDRPNRVFVQRAIMKPMKPQMDSRSTGSVRKRTKPSDAEQESHGLGPLSGTLTKVATTASILSGVPLISSFAGPAAWFSKLLANAAQVWGLSRPHNSASTTMMTRYIMNRFTNSDVADSSTKLGFMDSNEIEDLPGFAGTDIDEMSLNYVASISAWFNTITWTAAGATGDILYNASVGPNRYFTQDTVAAQTISYLSPVTFVTQQFALYRGSIKLTFKLVKTEFHTGRLLVVFYPYDASVNSSYPTPTIATSSYSHREVIDVRYGNEFSFILPYTSLTPYRTRSGPDSDYGRIVVFVLNELVAPANVPSSIPILMEASAAPDFEWAEPVDSALTVCQLYTPHMDRNECSIVDDVIGGAQIHMDTASARLCIGERVMSFRTLTKRFNQMLARGTPVGLNRYLNIFPFFNEGAYADGVLAQNPAYLCDSYSLIGSCYALSRGGVRIKVVDNTPSPANLPIAAVVPIPSQAFNPVNTAYFRWSAGPQYITNSNAPFRPVAYFRPDASGGVEIEFPYYNRTHSHPNCDTWIMGVVGNAMNPNIPSAIPRVLGYVDYTVTPTVRPTILRSASDDHSFGLFTSVPPMTDFVSTFMG